MKIFYFILLYFFFVYSQNDDTLLIKNAFMHDIQYNDYTHNFELIYTPFEGQHYPFLVSIDSNNTIAEVPITISSFDGVFWPNLDIRNGFIAIAWRMVSMSFNDYILGSVLNEKRELVYHSERINYDVADYSRILTDIAFIDDSLFFSCWVQIHQPIYSLRGKVLNVHEYGNYWNEPDIIIPDNIDYRGGGIKVSINDEFDYFPMTWRKILQDSITDGIYGGKFDKKFNLQSNIFHVDIDTVKYTNGDLFIIDSLHFLSCFVKYTSLDAKAGNILLNKVGFDGSIKSSSIVNDKLIDKSNINMTMAVNSDNYIVIAWDMTDEVDQKSQIIGQRYDSYLNKIGNNFIIASAADGQSFSEPKAVLVNKRVALAYLCFSNDSYLIDLVVKMFDFDNPTSITTEKSNPPYQFKLGQNYPNPFNASTTISFYLQKAVRTRINIFNTAGHKVATILDENKPVGKHQVKFDASALSSGIYFYRLEAGEFFETRKMLLLK